MASEIASTTVVMNGEAMTAGPVDTVSNAVYDGFLKSYGTIGVKSYGACVDLLVAYFK